MRKPKAKVSKLQCGASLQARAKASSWMQAAASECTWPLQTAPPQPTPSLSIENPCAAGLLHGSYAVQQRAASSAPGGWQRIVPPQPRRARLTQQTARPWCCHLAGPEWLHAHPPAAAGAAGCAAVGGCTQQAAHQQRGVGTRRESREGPQAASCPAHHVCPPALHRRNAILERIILAIARLLQARRRGAMGSERRRWVVPNSSGGGARQCTVQGSAGRAIAWWHVPDRHKPGRHAASCPAHGGGGQRGAAASWELTLSLMGLLR